MPFDFQITMVNWQEYLCDFLEMINVPGLRHYEATIKRGHYGLVDASAKLEILSELVNRVLESSIFRKKMDEVIEERHALGATRRGEALEDARKRREEKEQSKAELNGNESMDGQGQSLQNGESPSSKNNKSRQNGDVGKKLNGEKESSKDRNDLSGRRVFIILSCELHALGYREMTLFCFGAYYFI